ncbi:hypothetical protein BH10ACT2_BH10ACT2_21240 [soil metagenome]
MLPRSVTISLLIASSVIGACSNGSDGAASQTPTNEGGVVGGDFHSLVADPLVAGRIYVGGHAAVAQSNDSGASWVPIGPLEHADAMGWSIIGSTIWVSGHPGLTLSLDGGVTFEARNEGLPDTDVHAFGAAGDILYAAGPALGVAVSVDGGTTWATASSGVGQAFFGRILVDPADLQHLVAADVQQGVMQSIDGGQTWSALGTQPASWVSSGDGLATIYASGGPTAQRSTDGGVTWQSLTLPAGASLVEAGTDGALYSGVHDGNAVTVWFSANDGTTWVHP